ncbi:MAG: outer membrane protein assembly factor BamA [Gemmatimonadaceae bacterium]|nr:outer membrane protein assembly factor BamA [Gemmatimonadaceae bacterium]
MAAVLAMAVLSRPVSAQDVIGRCTTPDSIAIRGNSRIADQKIRTEAGLSVGSDLNFPTIQRAIKALYALNEFDDVEVRCDLESVPGKSLVVVSVTERLLLGDLKVSGPKNVSERSVREKVDLLIGRPIDPLQVARARARIDSLYEAAGYYLARVSIDSTVMGDGRIAIAYRIDEGRRLAISGIDVLGNARVRDGTIVGAMKTRPEGFWWFRKGEYNDDKYVGDLGERIPALYSRLGYVDMRITKDTLVVDRDRGKGLVEITVDEGPRYRIGSFEIAGNRRFSTEELKRLYPFEGNDPTLTQRVKGLIKREAAAPEGIFDQKKWDDAVEKVNTEYRNYGYLYARINPVVERRMGADSVPEVNLRWEIDEKNPAIVNRIEIVGNDYTVDDCIRRQINLVPGGVFNQQVLVRSYQSISNLNFFEAPMAFPDYRPINDQGDVDIIFRVKEKRTGSINFGASMGQGGVGFGGFIGVEQPNLFGLCKKGQLNWQYGRYYNDFTATYSDPALRGSRVSGALSAYRTQSRFIVGNLGQNIRTGSQLRFGLPVPWSLFSTFAVSYNGESATFTSGTVQNGCTKNCFRSNIGLEYTYDTRVDMPFASAGSLRSVTMDFSGGPLGGTVNFQRITGEFRAYAPLAEIGGKGGAAGQPIKFVMGLTARTGALFGNSGPFFFQQQFSVGGVQFGQQLRGYQEFSITPNGFNPTTDQYRSDPNSFGNAFLTVTGEIGMRFNQMFYVNAFTDAGNNWASARQINPTRLFRSAGVGVSTVTPLGPLGLDLAYGFDRVAIDPVTLRAKPDPRWQFHFRLGQLF